MNSPIKKPYEPAPEGTPTSIAGSNISLLQTNFSLNYHKHREAALFAEPGDHKIDLTKLCHGTASKGVSKD